MKVISSAPIRALNAPLPGTMEKWVESQVIIEALRYLLPKAEKVYDISWRHEILGEAVPNKDKIFPSGVI